MRFALVRKQAVLSTRIGLIALAALLSAACGGYDDSPAAPSRFSTTVVFGASLTDTGNACSNASNSGCPPAPPYAAGRFSNGPLFVETIAARYGAAVTPSTQGGNNYAYAGARTGAIPGLTTQSTTLSMVSQLDLYLKDQSTRGQQISDQALFVIDASTFGNNITTGLPLIGAATITPAQLVTAGVTDIVGMMLRLYAAGARNILVINAPDVGDTPLALALGPATAGAATQLSAGFNQALAGQITQLTATSPGLTVYTVDLFTLGNQIVANPTNYGFTNVTAPCVLVVGNAATICTTPSSYLYWDSFHPTSATGNIIAQNALALLPAP